MSKAIGYIHVYRDDGTQDLYGKGRCGDCGLPASNRLHRVPDVHPDAVELDRRKVGESEPVGM